MSLLRCPHDCDNGLVREYRISRYYTRPCSSSKCLDGLRACDRCGEEPADDTFRDDNSGDYLCESCEESRLAELPISVLTEAQLRFLRHDESEIREVVKMRGLGFSDADIEGALSVDR